MGRDIADVSPHIHVKERKERRKMNPRKEFFYDCNVNPGRGWEVFYGDPGVGLVGEWTVSRSATIYRWRCVCGRKNRFILPRKEYVRKRDRMEFVEQFTWSIFRHITTCRRIDRYRMTYRYPDIVRSHIGFPPEAWLPSRGRVDIRKKK